MAALLRHGARRIGASVVQRTKAAFTTRAAGEQRRLVTTEHAKPGPLKDLQASLREVDEMKEELYDLISLMDGTPTADRYKNRQLLKFLSGQVKPRPGESHWREMRASKRSKDLTETTIFVSTCILGYQYWSSLAGVNEVTQTEKKQEQ